MRQIHEKNIHGSEWTKYPSLFIKIMSINLHESSIKLIHGLFITVQRQQMNDVNMSYDYIFIITLDTKKPGSTQKCLVRHRNALLTMHQLTLPLLNIPFLLKSFSNYYLSNIFFKEPMHKFEKIPLSKRWSSEPPSGQGFTMHPTRTS